MQHRAALGKVDATSPDVVDISRAETQKVADGSVMDCGAPIEVPDTSSLHSNIMTALDQGKRVGKGRFLCLGLEMKLWSPREGCHQAPDHCGEEGQECWIGGVLPSLKGGAERGLMRDGDQWVNIREEIIHQQPRCGKRADGLYRRWN
jgi:hypothetical protein